jgi:hypothetical protein
MSAAQSKEVNITSAKLALTTSVPRNTIPTAKFTIMDGQTARRSRPVSNWRKTVRPSASDYKPFRTKPIGFVTTAAVSTIQSHGLEHLIDPDYVVKDAALDQLNAAKILQDIMQAPPAKAIVVRHLKDKDTRPPMEGDSRSLRLHDSAANS